MSVRAKSAAYCLALLFVGAWAETVAFGIKFADFPFHLGPAVAFTLFIGGCMALVASLVFAVLTCSGGDE